MQKCYNYLYMCWYAIYNDEKLHMNMLSIKYMHYLWEIDFNIIYGPLESMTRRMHIIFMQYNRSWFLLILWVILIDLFLLAVLLCPKLPLSNLIAYFFSYYLSYFHIFISLNAHAPQEISSPFGWLNTLTSCIWSLSD